MYGNGKYGLRIFHDADGGSGGNGDQTNWQAKYEELQSQITSGKYVTQTSYAALQKNLEAAVNDRKQAETNLAAAESSIAGLKSEKDGLSKSVDDLTATNTTLSGEKASMASKLDRYGVIFKDFPHLASFEADGLLPAVGEGQKMEDVFKAFSEKIAGMNSDAVSEFKKTSTTPLPPKKDDVPVSASALLKEANSLMALGNVKGYEAKIAEYHTAKQREGTP